jgi:hypothetical protein
MKLSRFPYVRDRGFVVGVWLLGLRNSGRRGGLSILSGKQILEYRKLGLPVTSIMKIVNNQLEGIQ